MFKSTLTLWKKQWSEKNFQQSMHLAIVILWSFSWRHDYTHTIPTAVHYICVPIALKLDAQASNCDEFKRHMYVYYVFIYYNNKNYHMFPNYRIRKIMFMNYEYGHAQKAAKSVNGIEVSSFSSKL